MALRDLSKDNYGKMGTLATVKELQLGCMQRIADATELMAKNYAELIAERDSYKRCYHQGMTARQALERRISALKGVITKLKRKLVK